MQLAQREARRGRRFRSQARPLADIVEYHETKDGKDTIQNARRNMDYHDMLPPKLREFLSQYPAHFNMSPAVVLLMGEDRVIEYLERKLKNA